ncbi:AT-rich interactive domain-containing protein 5 isoform X2 [Brassica napus]|uniref:AT-rich interactive domain-containing protein 5 isoform X2 n=1 Tax=Brassica napus TaxID=3708 RepID=UPI0006AB4377|nr:AT-rich interactive domain-containing protein 5 isoform X2 [Brassica napus]
MADTEMEEQDVASEDKTLTLDTDLHLPDVPIADVDQSEKKISSDGGQEESSSTPQVAVESVKKWKTWLLSDSEVDEAGRPEDQQEFIKEVEAYNKENFLDFKAPKFYGQPLNCLKLWRAVIKLGGYDVVTASKLWRQVGESFNPPKTCTTVSWTFRIFYEKSLLEYEKHLRQNGELNLPGLPVLPPAGLEKEAISHQGSGSGRARRDAAARAMQGWHSQRLLESGDVTEPIVKDKGLSSTPKQKNLKNIGVHKQKTPSGMDLVLSHETDKQSIAEVIDVGPPADWVKITVRETKDCFEIFALIPGLLREEVRVQSDPAGRLVIAGQPEQLDNPWGITPFKKVVNFPARIDPLHTSAVVSLHGRLFVRVPFEQ